MLTHLTTADNRVSTCSGFENDPAETDTPSPNPNGNIAEYKRRRQVPFALIEPAEDLNLHAAQSLVA
jgi:hypothetical protein